MRSQRHKGNNSRDNWKIQPSNIFHSCCTRGN